MGNKDPHPPILVQKYLNGSGRFTRSVLVRQKSARFRGSAENSHPCTIKPPTAGVQLVGHTSIKAKMWAISSDTHQLHYIPKQGWKLTLARGELNSIRASGSSDLTSPVGEWEFYGDLLTIS